MLRLERPADPGLHADLAGLAFEIGPILSRQGYAMSGRAAVVAHCPAASPAGELMFLANTNHVRDPGILQRALQQIDAGLSDAYQVEWTAPFRLDHIPTLVALGSVTSRRTGAQLPVMVGADVQLRPAMQLGDGTLIAHPAELAAERLARLAETDAGPTVLADVHHLVSLVTADRQRWGRLDAGELVRMAAAKHSGFVVRKDRVITAIDMVGHGDYEFPGVAANQLAEFGRFWKSCEHEVRGLHETSTGRPPFRVRRKLREVRPLPLPLNNGYGNAPAAIGTDVVPAVWDDGTGPPGAAPGSQAAPVEPVPTVPLEPAPPVPPPGTWAPPAPAPDRPIIFELVGTEEGASLAAELSGMAVGYAHKSPILKRSVIQRASDVVTSRLGLPPDAVDCATPTEQAALRKTRLAAGRPGKTIIFDVGARLDDVVATIVTFAHGRAIPQMHRNLSPDDHLRACHEASAAWIAGFTGARPGPRTPNVPTARPPEWEL